MSTVSNDQNERQGVTQMKGQHLCRLVCEAHVCWVVSFAGGCAIYPVLLQHLEPLQNEPPI